jgi:hypothetical protein
MATENHQQATLPTQAVSNEKLSTQDDVKDTEASSVLNGSATKAVDTTPSGQASEKDIEEGLEKEPVNEFAEDTSQYLTGIKLITLIIALCLAVFLVALDQTIIATAIPKITDHFNSISDIGWYGSAYFLTSTSLQPTFGRIYKVFNVKIVFLIAIGVFELGSLVCATAPSSTALIIGRAIAGKASHPSLL